MRDAGLRALLSPASELEYAALLRLTELHDQKFFAETRRVDKAEGPLLHLVGPCADRPGCVPPGKPWFLVVDIEHARREHPLSFLPRGAAQPSAPPESEPSVSPLQADTPSPAPQPPASPPTAPEVETEPEPPTTPEVAPEPEPTATPEPEALAELSHSPETCAACAASKLPDWKQDLTAATSLTVAIVRAGERLSLTKLRQDWNARRGPGRECGFQAFLKSLPEQFREGPPPDLCEGCNSAGKLASAWRADIAAAVTLAVKRAGGKPLSRQQYKSAWLQIRGEIREQAVRAFFAGLPSGLKNENPGQQK